MCKAVQSVISKFDAIITEGHPLYGHQCYSKALAAAAGYPVGDVRAPITTFESLGAEGRERVARMVPLMEELDRIVDAIEGRQAAAE
jgi:4-hydroxy-tetrahydrodipicolinate synthase